MSAPEAVRRRLADAAHANRRIAPFAGDVVEVLGPALPERPDLKVHHVEEFARVRLPDGDRHRLGFVALTNAGVAVGWRHGWRRRRVGRLMLGPDDALEVAWHERGLHAETDDGSVELEWMAGSTERAEVERAFWHHAPLG